MRTLDGVHPMPRSVEQLAAEARGLSRDERARLAEALIASLDTETALDREWLAEAQRRAAELDTGAVQGIPAEKVFAEIDTLIER